MRQSALLYLGANPTKWLRRAIEVIDDEVAALCRRHWEQPRVAMLRIPVSGHASDQSRLPRWRCAAMIRGLCCCRPVQAANASRGRRLRAHPG
jgi:hypothetical protein